MDCSPPGSSVHGISQAKILEWVAVPFTRGSSWPRDWTCTSCIAGGILITEPPSNPIKLHGPQQSKSTLAVPSTNTWGQQIGPFCGISSLMWLCLLGLWLFLRYFTNDLVNWLSFPIKWNSKSTWEYWKCSRSIQLCWKLKFPRRWREMEDECGLIRGLIPQAKRGPCNMESAIDNLWDIRRLTLNLDVYYPKISSGEGSGLKDSGLKTPFRDVAS